jgi:hypothetical protein
MGKFAPDATIDASLDYIAGSTYMTVCSGSPVTYADAYTNLMLAKIAVTSGSFTKADDTSGRKVTMDAKPGVSITNSGTALAVALVEISGSTLRYVTTCTSQSLTAGGTVDIPSLII